MAFEVRGLGLFFALPCPGDALGRTRRRPPSPTSITTPRRQRHPARWRARSDGGLRESPPDSHAAKRWHHRIHYTAHSTPSQLLSSKTPRKLCPWCGFVPVLLGRALTVRVFIFSMISSVTPDIMTTPRRAEALARKVALSAFWGAAKAICRKAIGRKEWCESLVSEKENIITVLSRCGARRRVNAKARALATALAVSNSETPRRRRRARKRQTFPPCMSRHRYPKAAVPERERRRRYKAKAFFPDGNEKHGFAPWRRRPWWRRAPSPRGEGRTWWRSWRPS